MKTNGISFFEQNVEKIVLGVSGVVFVSVVVWQLFPNSVTLGSESVPLGEVDRRIAEKATVLRGKLEQRQEPLAAQIGDRLAATAPAFQSKLAQPLSPSPALPRIEPRLASVLQSDGAAAGEPFHVPKFPAVAMRPTVQIDDTLESTVLTQIPDLKTMFTSSVGPFDLSWTVPSAVVDLKTIRTELESSADGAQIPRLWYRGTIFIVDVEFERQRKLADGTWGETTLVTPLPGAFSFRPEIVKSPDAGLRDAVWEYLSDPAQQRQIVQPDFLPTKRDNFSPGAILADAGTASSGEDPEIRRLRLDVAKKTIERDRLQEDLKGIGGPLDEAPKDDKKRDGASGNRSGSGSAGGGSGGRPGGGGAGGGGSRPPGGGLSGGGAAGGMSGGKNTGGADPRDERTKEKRIAMTKRLREAERRLTASEERLNKKLADAGLTAEKQKEAAQSSGITGGDSLTVWGHDIAVKAGETYRYRAVVRTYNPFFTNGGVLVEAQKNLGDPFTMGTAVAQWGEPFTVTPPIAFFVIDAVPGEGRLGIGAATVEIYRYYDGERRRERVSVQPGEMIGAGKSRDGIDFDTGFYLVDVLADPATDRGGSDRRPAAVAVVQSVLGQTYQVRVPRQQVNDTMRVSFEDEIELSKAEGDGDQESDAPATSGAATGGAPAGGAGTGRDGNSSSRPRE
ncbi:MAG: hypothetical protein RLY21_174 [Planctomycetota bacterium]|jgi:hypothetical protein